MVEKLDISQLREDVRNYFAEHLESPEHYKELTRRAGEEGCIEDYERHKRNISNLCGWDAPKGRYNQGEYDLAIEILKEKLEIKWSI